MSTAHEFHNNLKIAVVCMMSIGCLCIISYLLLDYFRGKAKKYEDVGQTELPFMLCVLCSSFSLGSMLLVPLTILSNEILSSFPSWEYLNWLSSDVIVALWRGIFLGSNTSLYIILPFAYFFYEAEGLFVYKQKIVGRIYEALVVMFILLLLLLCYFYVIQKFQILASEQEFLAFCYSLMSLLGSFLFVLCVPEGIEQLIAQGLNIYKPIKFSATIVDELTESCLETEVTKNQLQNALLFQREDIKRRIGTFPSHNSIYNEERDKKVQELTLEFTEKVFLLKKKQEELQHNHPFFHFILTSTSLSTTSLNLILFAYIVGRVGVMIFLRLWEEGLRNDIGKKLPSFLLRQQTLAHSSLTGWLVLKAGEGTWIGILQSLIETIVVIYLMIAVIVGFYKIPLFSYLKPKKKGTHIQKLLANTALFLLISSSFPIAAKVLGLITFDVMSVYNTTGYLRNSKFILCYCFIFMTSLFLRFIRLLREDKTFEKQLTKLGQILSWFSRPFRLLLMLMKIWWKHWSNFLHRTGEWKQRHLVPLLLISKEHGV